MENKESAVEWLYGVFELYAKGKREAPNWWDLERAIHMENDQLLTNVIAPPYTDEMCRYRLGIYAVGIVECSNYAQMFLPIAYIPCYLLVRLINEKLKLKY
jgi:hypothetical protein